MLSREKEVVIAVPVDELLQKLPTEERTAIAERSRALLAEYRTLLGRPLNLLSVPDL